MPKSQTWCVRMYAMTVHISAAAVGMINTDDQKQDNWTKLSQSALRGVLLSTWHVSDFQTV